MSDQNSSLLDRVTSLFDCYAPALQRKILRREVLLEITAAPAPLGVDGDLLALADSWVPDGSDEKGNEFDQGYEQALRECATELRREALRQRSPRAEPVAEKTIRFGYGGWECCGNYGYNGDCCYRPMKVTTPPTGLSAEEVEALERAEKFAGKGSSEQTVCAALRRLAGVRGDAIPRVVLELPDGDNRQAKVRWTEWKGNDLHVCLTVTAPPTGLSAEEVEALELCEAYCNGSVYAAMKPDIAAICAALRRRASLNPEPNFKQAGSEQGVDAEALLKLANDAMDDAIEYGEARWTKRGNDLDRVRHAFWDSRRALQAALAQPTAGEGL